MNMKKAFTLIELIMTMLIMSIIMAIATASFFGIGKGSAMRSAETVFGSCISLSRQWAITHRAKVVVDCNRSLSNRNWFVVSTNWNEPKSSHGIISSNNLPSDVRFLTDTSFVFKTVGGLDQDANAEIIIFDIKKSRKAEVNFLTGMTQWKEVYE